MSANNLSNSNYSDDSSDTNGDPDGKGFDSAKFNSQFETQMVLTRLNNTKLAKEKLAQLNRVPLQKKPYQMSVGEILVGIKNTWFDILDDVLAQNFSQNIITKHNRLFFIGLTFIIFGMVLYFYNAFADSDVDQKVVEKIVEIRHIVDKRSDSAKILSSTSSSTDEVSKSQNK